MTPDYYWLGTKRNVRICYLDLLTLEISVGQSYALDGRICILSQGEKTVLLKTTPTQWNVVHKDNQEKG